jgi:DNA-binding transcriptional LysR family regulator
MTDVFRPDRLCSRTTTYSSPSFISFPSISREIILRTLREHGLRWSIRFESGSIASLRAAVLAGLGVAVFGVGMIPNGVNVLPPSLLPELADAEYLLDWRPDCTDRVVVTFGSILRLIAPLIIQQLVDDQTPLLLAAGDPGQHNYRASDTLQMY